MANLPGGSMVPATGATSTATAPNASYSSGVGTGNGAMPTGGVLDPFTGFAKRYDPSFVGQFYDNPNLMLNDVLQASGMNSTGAGLRQAEMGDYSKNMRDLAALMIMSGSQGGQSQQDEALLNTAAKLMQQGMGAGGQSVQAGSALQMLLNPQANGALSRYLIGDPGNQAGLGLGDQASVLNGLFQSATSGINPYTQRALASSYGGALNNAQSDMLHGQYGQGQNPELYNYVKRNMTGIFPGL